MRKFVTFTVLVIAGLFCFTQTGFAQCVFPDNPSQAAPTWVCSDLNPGAIQVEGYPYLSVGDAGRSGVGAYYDRETALFEARNRMSGRIRTVVTNSISRYMSVIGIDSKVIDKYVEMTAIQFTHSVLEDTPVLATACSQKGHLYVLIGMNKKVGDKHALKEVKASFNKHKAQYQRKLGKDAFEKLEKRIDKAEDNPEIMSDDYYEKDVESEYFRDPQTGELVKKVYQKEEEQTTNEAKKKE